jgi:hypothetical protein
LFEDLGIDALQDEVLFFGLALFFRIRADEIRVIDIPIAKFMYVPDAFERGKLLGDKSIVGQVHSPGWIRFFDYIPLIRMVKWTISLEQVKV